MSKPIKAAVFAVVAVLFPLGASAFTATSGTEVAVGRIFGTNESGSGLPVLRIRLDSGLAVNALRGIDNAGRAFSYSVRQPVTVLVTEDGRLVAVPCGTIVEHTTVRTSAKHARTPSALPA